MLGMVNPTSQKSKRPGRKQKHYTDSQGVPVPGLSRRPSDGRWRVIGTQQTFTEPDEAKAIQKFLRLTKAPIKGSVGVAGFPVVISHDRAEQLAEDVGITKDELIDLLTTDDQRYIDRVKNDLTTRPKWLAEVTGIEELGYLDTLKAPTPLPTLDEIEAIWELRFKKSADQKRKVKTYWTDFKETAKIKTLKDIDAQSVTLYKNVVYDRDFTPKYQDNIFNGVRRMLTFAASEALGGDVGMAALNAAAIPLALLVPSGDTININPKPLKLADWQTLLSHATGDVKAQILLMLNGGFYASEVVRLEWDEITENGCIVTRRLKEGNVIRACVLWPETLEALKHVKRKGKHLFYSYSGLPLSGKAARERFDELAKKAGLEITSSQLRDSVATAIARGLNRDAKHSGELEAIVLGHRTGIRDSYVLSCPEMVRPACEAIRSAYFP
jgi:integrase